MIVTIVYVHVLEEHIQSFISACEENHDSSIREAGNLRFDVLQKDAEEGEFVLYEAYENEAAAAAHKETPHYLRWRETVAPMMDRPREGVKYRGIKP